jgi:hypothetical protein
MTVLVRNPRNNKRENRFVHSFTICKDDDPLFDVEYESNVDIFTDSLDPALPVVLFPAMKAGRSISFKGKVSEKLFSNSETIQNIFHTWYKDYSVVDVQADEHHSENLPNRGVACFFTAGLDSSYTLVKNFDEITHLIYVDGFYDSRKGNESITEAHLAHLRQVAKKIDKTLIEIRTNLRDFMDDYGIWGDHNHGAGLASVGLLLSKHFHKIYLASSHTYDVPLPWGSTPLMDRFWSTESLQFIHHGAEATRVRKTAEVVKNQKIMNSLRVCFGAVPNCGTCEKCVRTMIHLKIAGALDRCTAFLTKDTVTPEYISRLYIKLGDVHTKAVFDENIKALKETRRDRELVEALEDCLHGVYRKKLRGFPKRVMNLFRRKVLAKFRTDFAT